MPVRYLVLIASERGQPLDDIRYRELRSARELRDGDQVFLDELLMRVRAVLSPNDNQHDGLLICGPDES